MMWSRFAYLCTMACLLMGSFGCTGTFVAEKYPVDPNTIPEFTGGAPITVINAQENQNEEFLGSSMGVTAEANLHQFTEIAIETLEGELKKKNITAGPNAEKELRIAVTKASFNTRFPSGHWCDTTISVETSDGYKVEIDGHESNANMLQPCVNGSLHNAAVAVLNDDKVIEFLEK